MVCAKPKYVLAAISDSAFPGSSLHFCRALLIPSSRKPLVEIMELLVPPPRLPSTAPTELELPSS